MHATHTAADTKVRALLRRCAVSRHAPCRYRYRARSLPEGSARSPHSVDWHNGLEPCSLYIQGHTRLISMIEACNARAYDNPAGLFPRSRSIRGIISGCKSGRRRSLRCSDFQPSSGRFSALGRDHSRKDCLIEASERKLAVHANLTLPQLSADRRICIPQAARRTLDLARTWSTPSPRRIASRSVERRLLR